MGRGYGCWLVENGGFALMFVCGQDVGRIRVEWRILDHFGAMELTEE
jgi:hypothetical protein